MPMRRRGWWSYVTVAALPLVARLMMLLFIGVPEPYAGDEMSYLLAGDTFAHGRLTNPPHPMAHFFETYHELMTPTYASKYPPAQGLFLALGQVVFGHPWFGVLLSYALMTAAFCWMLQGWGPSWAAWLVAASAGLHWALVPLPAGAGGHWMNSYWGGAVAAGAGALVLGAAGRFLKRFSAGASRAFAVGASVLALSRPLEGLVLIILVLVALGWVRPWSAPAWRGRAWAAAPALAVGLACLVFIGVYNRAVTGSATTFPYLVYDRQYAQAPGFWILPPASRKVYAYEEMRRVFEEADLGFYRSLGPYAPAITLTRFLFILVPALVAPAWLLPLCLGWRGRRTPARRLLLVVLAGCVLLWLLMKIPQFHYMAPAVGIVLIVVSRGVRQLRAMVRFQPRLMRAAPAALFMTFAGATLLQAFSMRGIAITPNAYLAERRAVISQLTAAGGRHLVIVHYTPQEDPNDQFWIFNAADIDRAPIVWAHDNGRAGNQPLLDYFRGRRVWLLESNAQPFTLRPYE